MHKKISILLISISVMIMLLSACDIAQTHMKSSQKLSKVCLTDDNGEPLSTATSESITHRPYVQLLDTRGNQLLPASTYKLPLGFKTPANGCFDQPFILTHKDKTYQWFNANGEVLYDIYWFDNGSDYPQDGLFRFKKNALIGYANADTFDIVIPAQYQAAHPFEDGQAKVSYKADIQRVDNEHSAWVNTDYFIIDKLGNSVVNIVDTKTD